MKFPFTIFIAFLCLAPLHIAAAQSYPVRPIRLIFPLVPGSSSNDILGRALAQRLSESLGQSIVADYRPGAAGNIGSALAAKAAPDGYALLIGYTSSIMIGPSVYANAGFDPVSDLAPIARIAIVPYVIVAHPSVQATTVKELIALAKARPGELNYASSGSGSLSNLSTELFKIAAHVDIMAVHYKAAAPASNELLGGHVQLHFTGIPSVAAFIKSGRLRAIAVTTLQRSPLLPALPTVHESGLPGYDVSSALGILAPARTPRAIVQRLYQETANIVNGEDMKNFV
ncbi:MAG TPA: tripartite tricarboxylate transporter substrate-binding protein, partial [Burkholderiales bacterium]|nr:tripartite tricarboxylate transporter substrate-binding protein [Burkholderiales bacterium]